MKSKNPQESTWHTSSRLYFSKRLLLGNIPIESFTGIRCFSIILCPKNIKSHTLYSKR